jgi:hypothetical protein
VLGLEGVRPEPPFDEQLPSPPAWGLDRPLWWVVLIVLACGGVGGVATLDAMNPHRNAEMTAHEQGDTIRRALGWRPVGGPAASELADACGVELLTATEAFDLGAASGKVSAEPPSAAAVATFVPLLGRELGRYPGRFLPRCNLRRVLLCGRLSQEGQSIPSLPNVEGTLLLDLTGDEAYVRHLVHHEVFHFFDHADDGHLGNDEAWAALNPPRFRYGDGGRSMRTPGTAVFDAPLPGFVSLYATSAVEEDKAEVFALALSEPALASSFQARDPILAAKLTEARRRLDVFLPAAWDRLLRP